MIEYYKERIKYAKDSKEFFFKTFPKLITINDEDLKRVDSFYKVYISNFEKHLDKEENLNN